MPKPLKAIATLEEAQERITELQTLIEQGLEGERTWSQAQITQATQELADLKATLATLTEALPNTTELREQLTQTQQELAEVKAQLATISQHPLPNPPEPEPVPAPPIPANPAPKENIPNEPNPANNRIRGKRLL